MKSNWGKRLPWIAVALLVVGYWGKARFDRYQAKRHSEQETEHRIIQARAVVDKLVTQHLADETWRSKLTHGQRYRASPIFTVELEKLWLTDKPILLLGVIEDVSSKSEGEYLLKIEEGLMGNVKDGLLTTGLAFELVCPKATFEEYQRSQPKRSLGSLEDGVAVIAKIKSLGTERRLHNEDTTKDYRIGYGTCLALGYTGSVSLSEIRK